MGLRPPDEVLMDPLGTVEARTSADAYARAEARWADVPARAFRVRTARAAGVGALGVALARDVERDAGRGR